MWKSGNIGAGADINIIWFWQSFEFDQGNIGGKARLSGDETIVRRMYRFPALAFMNPEERVGMQFQQWIMIDRSEEKIDMPYLFLKEDWRRDGESKTEDLASH